MVSQRYLQLLDEIPNIEWAKDLEYSDNINDEWGFFTEDWQWYIEEEGKKEKHIFYLVVDLKNLAYIGYYLISQVTHESIDTILSRAKKLHENKNAGYSGDSTNAWLNFRGCEEFGINVADGCLTRLCDKYHRYKALNENSALDKVGESIIDTLMDLSAYCLILICLLEEETNEGTI